MSVAINEIVTYCQQLLEPSKFKDYCPNGLQVAGRDKINKIVSGVTACQQLLDAAVLAEADVILVHHGYFWRGEQQNVVSIKRNRLQTLLVNDLNLLAYHLPLDAHHSLGNNVQLANKMGWKICSGMNGELGEALVLLGETAKAMYAGELSDQLARVLNRQPLHIAGHQREIKRIAWCTGAAQSFIEEVASTGVDAFISGEISEQTVHLARELGLDYFAAGHHATESYGVQALGEHLAEHFSIEHEFINIHNPV
ncbi:MAG: Nif3-like dinuclear metal center hexameric protein [Pseudomonadales bacterium]|nr:Nif3-like dinuclear metal center hexameric protein [Pseudomonadales bacterium]NRA16335.1 Nif3-like dinuclear metal center hexameric protein [Oceanospirillaceae bacterium]